MLLLDAGDGLTGTGTPPTNVQGTIGLEIMNMLGYDAATLGEGDLIDLGVSVIRQRMETADFPIISANVFLSGTDELLAQPFVIREMGEHHIAIIGVTAVVTTTEVEVRDPLASVQEAVKQVQDQADIIILLSHAGLSVNQEIAKQVSEIDLIISGGGKEGYTPAPLVTGSGPVIVHADTSSPGHAGRRIGVGTWSFDDQGQLIHRTWKSLDLGPEILEDPGMLELELRHPQ